MTKSIVKVLKLKGTCLVYKVGDMVACTGTGYANHAEIVCVPQNLVVKIPRNLDFKEAASVTLGAMAMQRLGRAKALMLCE